MSFRRIILRNMEKKGEATRIKIQTNRKIHFDNFKALYPDASHNIVKHKNKAGKEINQLVAWRKI